jgi:hypothetical protein
MSMHVQRWLSGLYPAWRGKGHLVRDGHGKDPLARTEAPVKFFNRLRQMQVPCFCNAVIRKGVNGLEPV